ncbi:MAG TPA: hypothetical protein VK522_18770 [Pseudolabrys sp.]|nr:hypothetical protein [Pseudolabrys sp.]
MLRTFADELMGANAAIIIVLAHVAALAWAVMLHKGMVPALILNLVVSAAIVAYNAGHLVIMLRYADYAPLALMAYAVVIFACAASALCGLRIPAWINWTAFAVNLALSILLLAFLWFFKINRLF